MATFHHVPPDAVIVGYDFSTGGVKALAFNLKGEVGGQVKLPTDLWTAGGVSELNLMQLEGQARAVTRVLVGDMGASAHHWAAAGISATHHTAGRISHGSHCQIRRAICWNDQTLGKYHAIGLERLGGQDRAKELTGGPWAVRYSLSHLVKDEFTLSAEDWNRTQTVLPHGPLAAGYLTGRFDVTSVSSAASTGIMDLRTNQWCQGILDAIANPKYRELAWDNLPEILDMNSPIGPIAEHVALDARLPPGVRPLVFPTLDDHAAGLLGGGAVDAGHVAVILGNSAVVNSSSSILPKSGTLDAMKLNWGPYLWMRCYSNGAQFLDRVVGEKPDWAALEAAGRKVEPLCGGAALIPFALSEPSIGITEPWFEWVGGEPSDPGVRVRASFEALAYLIALGVREHEAAGQVVTRVTVSGGIARSALMCDILASVLGRELDLLESDEGTALGAAAVALAGLEQSGRTAKGIAEPFTVADAVAALVRFRPDRAKTQGKWVEAYRTGLAAFEERLKAK